ncbi:LysR family transcriptional regulator [Sphingomonas aquatilis NBRC 16722]|uniref:LysR family transcriptional regulator of beta-lactamase n=2 Tax=Sphingomonas aquatilis TaxID=93063 RepID=A0AAW3TN80_9SPHN|nr:LysR family transcriptional regulator of beta-lactamase [Sphingomonas aquatilis]GEM71683.1 LysR family transcriptional regulator [Sphingomonas aquatilis NBRC 16722]
MSKRMDRAQLPLNALRAFEAAARHLNFTRAAIELCVSQGAVSHQVAQLERRLGTRLFHRLPRGLALTDDGHALVPVLAETFDRIGATLDGYADGRFRHPLHIGVVGTFATGWLIERIDDFDATHPHIDLRLAINNNRVDLAGEGLDYAIRFGDGAWHGTAAEAVLDAPLTPLCAPAVAARLTTPADLARERLLRSYRPSEWSLWFAAAGADGPPLRGPMFDSSALMAGAAAAGQGVALAPRAMCLRDLASERLIQPFAIEVDAGRYWLTRLLSRKESPAMQAFRRWLLDQSAAFRSSSDDS